MRYWDQVNDAIKRGSGGSLKPVQTLQQMWFQPLREAIVEEKRQCSAGEAERDRLYYGPFIRRLSAESLALITMDEVFDRLVGEPSAPMASTCADIGRAVIAELNFKQSRMEKHTYVKRDGQEGMVARSLVLKQRFKSLTPRHINWWSRKNLDDPIWSMQAQGKIGTILLRLLLRVAHVEVKKEFVPALETYKAARDGKKYNMLKLTDAAQSAIDAGHARRQYLRPRYLPMIVPPYPWKQVKGTDGKKTVEGGYTSIRTPFVSQPLRCQKNAYATSDMTELFDCLDAVCATPGAVALPMLELTKQFYADYGGDLVGLPLRNPLPFAPKPDDIDTNEEARREWKDGAKKVYEEEPQRQGERCNFERALSVATQMSKYEKLWWPHQLDFRSRVIPIPTHLNVQCNDVVRGMLRFAEPVEVTEEGRYWLRVHAANCYGVDKVPFDERVEWSNDHEKQITSSANDPHGEEFWLKAEDPWQFQAACRALSNDDEAARLPIGMDGTCSGLQHYAALGLDGELAALVNMLPASKPSDVYTAVAGVLGGIVAEDCGRGIRGASIAAGRIDRKACKLGTMTYCYDVRDYGIEKQFYDHFRDLGMDEEKCVAVAKYLAPRLRESIGTKCKAAADIMEWMRECGQKLTKTGKTIEWTTPLGFPVVQPYFMDRRVREKTATSELTFHVRDEDKGIDKPKQVRGMIPGIIHSLDATHMFMNARACRHAGIAYWAVHDKFFTHPSHVPTLSRIVREQFVKLYRQDHLAKLSSEWTERFGVALSQPPARGGYQIESILGAPYAFS